MTNERGFSLIEVLFAMALIAVASTGLAVMSVTAYDTAERSGRTTQLVIANEERMEWVRNQPYAALSAGTVTENLTGTLAGYVRTTVVQDDQPMTGVKQVAVSTTDPRGQTVTFVSVISD